MRSHKKNIVCVLAIFLFTFCNAFSQYISEFEVDTATFPEQLHQLLKNNMPEETEEMLEVFANKWKSEASVFTYNNKIQIINNSNKLLKSKGRPYPHFNHYLKTILAFAGSQQPMGNFINWNKGLELLLDQEKPLSVIDDYFKHTIPLITENIIYKSSSTEWVASNDDFTYQVDDEIKVIFNKTDLSCYAKRDSLKIHEARGVFYPVDFLWRGSYAKVTWERAGYDTDNIYAILGDFDIDMTSSKYEADSITFYHKTYMNRPLQGALEDQVMRISSPENASYPKFTSYTKSFRIENLYENIDYEGGFRFEGSKMIGSGDKEEDAHLYFYNNDTLFLKANSKYFIFKKDRLRGLNTSIAIYFRKDSIYHPSLLFNYLVDNKELSLLKTDNILSRSPYFNSYHNINMDFEQLTWVVDEPVVYFEMKRGAAQGNGEFTSQNFFSKQQYAKMRGMDDTHPLVAIQMYCNKHKVNSFTAKEFAEFIRKPVSSTRQLLLRIAAQGFIYFDTDDDVVEVKEILHVWLDALMEKIDYDVINFKSRTHVPLENASLNLQNFDLIINGMPRVQVSDAQDVQIVPRGQRIILKRNRNFQFDGVIGAGLFTFFGHNFFFEYDTFKINLQNVDSISIKVRTGSDDLGRPVYQTVKNLLEHITGELIIDSMNNKSGKVDYPKFPVFKSKEYSYVYYDQKNVQSGVYTRDNFYFQVNPYVIDSLDNFTKEALRFKGTFMSAGIFPDIKQTLRLQNDLSLGFREIVPDEGYPAYKGKGTFFDTIYLSNKGLRGNGKLKYLTSTVYSDDFLFYPDSTNTVAQRFEVAEQTSGVQYPSVKSENVDVHWLPKEDEMNFEHKTEPFSIIRDDISLEGTMKLTPQGVGGSGKMNLPNAEMESDLITFNAKKIDADTADFKLKSLRTDGFTVKTSNVKAHLDYAKNEGSFTSNEDFSLVEFPENNYVSYLDYFEWDMNNKNLSMGTSKEYSQQDVSKMGSPEVINDGRIGPRYISTDPKQDSLNFVSSQATYDYEKNQLTAEEVEFIKIADARIYPKDEKIVVEENGKIGTLWNSRIIAHDTSEYHEFYNATTNIASRNKYKAEGKYDYIDETGKVQVISFNDIGVDDSLNTYGIGGITEKDSFFISPAYRFQGIVELSAPEKHLIFDGGVRLTDTCSGIRHDYMAFRERINPYNIFIPVPFEPVNISGENVYSGLLISNDSVHIYPAFFSKRKNYSDRYIVHAHGVMYYGTEGKYEIASKEKLMNLDLPENYISLDKNTCNLYGEGELNLDMEVGQVELTTMGNVNFDYTENLNEFNMFLGARFFIDDEVTGIMTSHIDSVTAEFPVIDTNDEDYIKQMKHLREQQESKRIRRQDTAFSLPATPADMGFTLSLSHLEMKWDDETNSYRSVGDFGLASIAGKKINKMVEGNVELVKKRSGDLFDVFIKVDENNWYYFGYTRGVMQTLSSNPEYFNTIQDIPNRKRKMKVDRGQTSYIYLVSKHEKLVRFLKRIEIAEKREEKKKIEEQQKIEEQKLEEQQKAREEQESTENEETQEIEDAVEQEEEQPGQEVNDEDEK